jgi:hypothetical protein
MYVYTYVYIYICIPHAQSDRFHGLIILLLLLKMIIINIFRDVLFVCTCVYACVWGSAVCVCLHVYVCV